MRGTVTPGMTGNNLKTLTQIFLNGFLRREIIYFKYLNPDFFYMAFFYGSRATHLTTPRSAPDPYYVSVAPARSRNELIRRT